MSETVTMLVSDVQVMIDIIDAARSCFEDDEQEVGFISFDEPIRTEAHGTLFAFANPQTTKLHELVMEFDKFKE